MTQDNTRYGETRRVVTFNLDDPEQRELYQFSKGLKFGPLVKRYLREEMRRRQGQSSITVHVD